VEWCITGGDLYFLAGLVMYHSGVVNNTPETFLSARVVERVGFAGNHSIHAGLDVSGGPDVSGHNKIIVFSSCHFMP